MSPTDDTVRLRHMLDHSREAVAMAKGRCRSDLDADRQFGLALTRLLEIIGEAASRVSERTRSDVSSVPWPHITGLRNRLIHGYYDVDYDILWRTIDEDLPHLIGALRSALGDQTET